MGKDFDRWNMRKKKIENAAVIFKFHQGEIWWYAAGLNVGNEIDGKHGTFERPVFILKKCNAKMFIGIPCTSMDKTGPYMYLLKSAEKNYQLNFSQVRTVSAKRLLRKIANTSSVSEQVVQDSFILYLKRKPAV